MSDSHANLYASLYTSHVERLAKDIRGALAANHLDALVIDSGLEKPISVFDDRYWTFNPTPAFAHLSPISEPGAAIVVSASALGLYRPKHESYWEAPPPEPPSWWLAPFTETAPDATLSGRVAFIGEDDARASAWAAGNASVNPAALLASLDAIRAIKSAYEIAAVAGANAIAARGHVALAEAFASGDHSELELHLRYLGVTSQDDVDTPYKGIVALGRNAAVLHHNRYGRERVNDKSMLVDAGAKVLGYAADVTRTHVKGNGTSASFGALIEAVDGLQQDICARVTPGLSFEVLHDQTHELLAGVVRDLELASASAEELIDSGFTRALLPHGLGHSLGIQVHDVGCKIKPPTERNPFLRNTADVTIGHVFTVEPGCYFIDSLLEPLRAAPIGKSVNWGQIDELRPFGGIRIEDNVAVLETETKNLTRDNWPSPP